MLIHIKTDALQKEKWIISHVEYDGIGYTEVTLSKHASKGSVKRALGRCGRDTIACGDIPLCRKNIQKKLCEDEFDDRLTANAFALCVSGAPSALLIDPDGSLRQHILIPLTRVRTLYVLTGEPEAYEQTRSITLRTVGCDAVMLRSVDDFGRFEAVLMPHGTGNLCPTPRGVPVFGVGGFLPFGNTVSVKGKTFDRSLAAAFFTIAGSSTFGAALPQGLRKDRLVFTPKQLKNTLDIGRTARL